MSRERQSACPGRDERREAARATIRSRRLLWARALLLALSAAGLSTFACTVAARIGFAWPLEWMEGAILHHGLRLAAGQPLYAPPRAEFIAYLYPPLAYLPAALSVAWFGPSLPAARAASLACAALATFFVGRGAARASGEAVAGWVAAGLFALGFGYTGAFLDLVRVDACFVLLVAAAAERMLADRPRAALFCLVLAAFAKQHGAVLLAASSLALILRDPRAHTRSAALAWTALGLCAYALELASGGWFSRYALELPLAHGADAKLLFSFFAVDLLVYLPVLAIAAAIAIARRAPRITPFDALVVAAAITSALGRAHTGGHDNVRLPAFALLCIAGVAPLCRAALETPRPRVRAVSCAALALQFALLFQAPSFHAPPAGSARRFAELRAALLRCADGGRAVALDHALLANAPFMHTMALSDLRMATGSTLARDATGALLAHLRAPSAPAAIAVGESFAALDRVLAQHYRLCAEVPAPVPATGYVPGARGANGRVQRVYARLPR